MTDERWTGWVAGFGLAGLPGFVFLTGCWLLNPHFVDAPLLAWGLCLGVPGVFGALLGSRWRFPFARWPLGLVVGCATMVAGFSIHSTTKVDELELLIFGVDGATWGVLDPMISAGELPAFGRAQSRGASGRMRAPEPIFSPLIWTTMATGFPPSEHGVHGFNMTADALRLPRFWNIASAQGHTIGVYKWLVTWPPEELPRGFMVPGWLAKSSDAVPRRLEVVKDVELSQRTSRPGVASQRSELRIGVGLVREGLRFSTLLRAVILRSKLMTGGADPRRIDVSMQLLRVQIDRDVFTASLRRERPTVASFSAYATDALSHRYWRFHEPTKFADASDADLAQFGDVVRSAYRQADDILAEFQKILPEDARLIVVSDHGFQALNGEGRRVLPRTEPVSDWLENKGVKANVFRQGAKLRVQSDDPFIDPALNDFVAEYRLVSGMPLFRIETIPGSTSSRGIAVNDHDVELDLEDRLANGQPLGICLNYADGMSGDHHRDGIFIANGPGVEAKARVDITAVDLTPIILGALDIPPGQDMAGSVPVGIWPSLPAGPSWSGLRREIVFVSAEDEVGAEANQALKALGYVD